MARSNIIVFAALALGAALLGSFRILSFFKQPQQEIIPSIPLFETSSATLPSSTLNVINLPRAVELPANTSTSFLTDQKVFSPEASIITLPASDQGVFYSVSNTIFQFDFRTQSSGILLQLPEPAHINDINISPDRHWLMYTFRDAPFIPGTYGSFGTECASDAPTTLRLRSLVNNQEKEITRVTADRFVSSAQFLPDNTLFYITSAGFTVDSLSGKTTKLAGFEESPCLRYQLRDQSTDNRFLLWRETYYEGGGWSTYDQQHDQLSKSLIMPSIDGGIDILGFITTSTLLAYRSVVDDTATTSFIPRFEYYDTNLHLKRTLPAPSFISESWVADSSLSTTSSLQHITIAQEIENSPNTIFTTVRLDADHYLLETESVRTLTSPEILQTHSSGQTIIWEPHPNSMFWYVNADDGKAIKISEDPKNITAF